ncbi:uncharacterized protein DNG_01740 [Cephalotrichum gorgonifer]|uniref:DUF7708 domain-containing protein n=1 Tax=Cephalotrichum gorgonifer TaxID=2041049 RepID=A0AAE8MS91_9PEZI|nr:uncharacterized protein DNG_01740 [Cephalotrichum gorgonifer]
MSPFLANRSLCLASGQVGLSLSARLADTERKALWKEVDAEKEQLFELMQQVQVNLRLQSGQVDAADNFNLRECNWREVLGEVQRTAQRWKNRPSKQGKTMVFIDKMGRNSSALESWLGLLPMGDYGSSICGVFKLAVGAAGHYGKIEESIFEALYEIPRIMESAGRYVTLYRQMRDQFLEQRTSELFRSILKMLRQVMQFFADSKSQRVLGSLLKQGQYKDDLLKSLEEIKNRAQAVNEEAVQCQGRMLLKVYSNTESLSLCFQRFMQSLEASPRFGGGGPERHDLLEATSRREVSGFDWVNADHTAPSEDDEGGESLGRASRKRLEAPDRRASSVAHRAEVEHRRSRERLLQLLRYDPESLSRDVSSSLGLGYQLSDKARSRAATMIRHDKFRGFMEEVRSSRCLLVNGRDDLAAADGISPLSMVVAELVRMSETPGALPASAFVVKYFCAAHPASPFVDPESADLASAVSMMASLVGQLLSQMADRGIVADLSFLTDAKWGKVERHRPKILCTVFRRLVAQMPPGSVILCLIDEISLYETQMLRHQTDLVMEKLVKLAMGNRDGQEQRQVFKLLVTCQDRALGVARYFGRDTTLDLQEDVEADDSADWTISTMAF